MRSAVPQPVHPAPLRADAARRPSVWRRLFNAVWYAHQQKAMRDIHRIVAARDGAIDDRLEREIETRILRTGWDPGR